MYLYIDKSKYGHNTFYVAQSYRKEDGRNSTKIIERLGKLEDLEKIHDDPVIWAKKYIEDLNANNSCNKTIKLSYSTSKLIEKNNIVRYNGGYLFIQSLFYQLGLNEICKNISKKYKFKYNLSDILLTLISGRILYPSSKLSTFEESKYNLENHEFQLQDVYRSLDVISKEKDYIQSELYKNTLKLGKRNDKVLFYDCTNYYFELEKESGIKKYGVSKENRPNPIVQMGLFMDGDGIPLAFCINPGNTNEQKTLKPLENQIINDFKHSKFIVCTDAGLSSAENRRFNDIEDRAFITTQSIKKMKKFQKDWALSADGWHMYCDDKVVNIEDILNNNELLEKYKSHLFYKERWFNENNIEQRYIVTFSIKHMLYQRYIRNEQIERAKNAICSTTNNEKCRQSDYKRFITKTAITEDGEIAPQKVYTLNEDKIHDEEKYDGFYAVATNLEDKAPEIVRINKKRWEIEESFRIMKTEFDARPVYLSRDDRIEAHFTTCFLSLLIYRYLEKKIGHNYTCSQIISQLKKMQFYKQKEGYIPIYERNDFTDNLHEKFNFRTDYEMITHSNMKKIFRTTKKDFS